MTACHLVERCGAEAFAVATLEEGVALRRALEERFPPSSLAPRIRILVLGAPVGYPSCFDTYLHNDIELMVSGPEVAASLGQWMKDHEGRKRAEVERVAERRKEELMGDQVLDRNPMRDMVVRQGKESEVREEKDSSSIAKLPVKDVSDSSCATQTTCATSQIASTEASEIKGKSNANVINVSNPPFQPVSPSVLQTKMNAATLTNVTGDDLAREVRQILIGQQKATTAAALGGGVSAAICKRPSTVVEEAPAASADTVNDATKTANEDKNKARNGLSPLPMMTAPKKQEPQTQPTTAAPPQPLTNSTNPTPAAMPTASGGGTLFCGIEDAAKASRQKELRAIRRNQLGNAGVTPNPSEPCSRRTSAMSGNSEAPQIRKKLRWHSLVDSGMGRLGFKTDQISADGNTPLSSPTPSLEMPVQQHTLTGFHLGANTSIAGDSMSENSHVSGLSERSTSPALQSPIKRDTVAIIKELYEAEVHEGAPIEFYGMCTHMADANSTSTYTHSQMDRFRSLLHRVRAAGVAVPTISTDNSAALLTTSLTHFDPNAILSHDTRGFVRCGGAIYGQRPAFKELRAVSTLTATVKHVAVISEGESVGYDRAYVAPMDVRIATLTVGFADGYPRELGNGVGRVSIRGSTFPVAGNVCMDMLMVELGPAEDEGAGAHVTVGDIAVLWGPEGMDVENCGNGLVTLADLAATLKTTQSALTCGLDKLRVQRQFVD